MSYKTIASYLGKILLLSAFFYIVPCLVALIYGEYAQIPALAAASLVALAAGGVLLLFREKGRKLRTKESLVVVGLSWILISAIGALPFSRRMYSELSRLSFRNRFGLYDDGRNDFDEFRSAQKHAFLARLYALAWRNGHTCLYAGYSAVAGRGQLSADEIRIAGASGRKACQ